MSWCLTHFKQDSSQIILTSFTNICTRIYKSNNRFPIVILIIRYKCWNNKCDVHKLFWYIKSLFRYATIKTIKWIVICIFFLFEFNYRFVELFILKQHYWFDSIFKKKDNPVNHTSIWRTNVSKTSFHGTIFQIFTYFYNAFMKM